jgi:flagellin
VDGTSDTQFDVTFDPQTTLGAYNVVIGPGVTDFFGNPISVPFVSQFSITSERIVNGGFETGTFANWTLSGNTGSTFVGGNAHSGSFAANLGPVGSDGFIAQTFSTTAGTSYTLSYWLSNGGGPANDFAAYIDGVVVPGSQITNAAVFAYTQYTFTFVAAGDSTELKFGFRQDPSYFYLDDISVSPTPGPGPSGSAAGHAALVSATLASVHAPAGGGGVLADPALGSSGGGRRLLAEGGDTLAALSRNALSGSLAGDAGAPAAPLAGAAAFRRVSAAQRPAPRGTEALDGLFIRLGEETVAP